MSEPSPNPERRDFLKQAGSIAIGTAIGLPPVVAGLCTVLDPLGRKGGASQFIHVTSLNALPEDGTPRQFPVVADRQDAWNKFPQVRVGAIYLRRIAAATVHAINVVCPHAGCFVNFSPESKHYLCPCHKSTFGMDGKIKDPASPSPRGLDVLDVELRNGTEVWVRFQNFRAGVAEKVAAS